MFSAAVKSPSRLGSWNTIPKRLPDRALILLRVEAVELNGAAGGVQQRGEHFDGCGLPCSVGAEEGEYLARRHVERDVVDGGEGSKCLYEVLHPNQVSDLPGREIQY